MMHLIRHALLAVSLLALPFGLGACQHTAPTPFPTADVPNCAPPPYTAAEIRDHHPDGTYVVMLTTGAEGQMMSRQRTDFLEPDSTGVTIELRNVDESFEPVGDVLVSGRATWEELRSHAYFPAANTELSHGEVATPAGRFETWCYGLERTSEGGALERTEFFFAVGEPGPPVLMVTRVDGDEIQRMTMVVDGRPN